MESNKIELLKKVFRVSTAVFECANSIHFALTGVIIPNKMNQLHKIMLSELEKENVDLNLVDKLLLEMENLAHENSTKPNQ